jgi:hypothetical protein
VGLFRTVNLVFILSLICLDLWAQECHIYLAGPVSNPVLEIDSKSQVYTDVALPKRFKPLLKIPISKEAEALRNYIINQSLELDNRSLDLISRWLYLNHVEHVKLNSYIVIVPGENSALNRFAKKLTLFQGKYPNNKTVLPTQLIFDPGRLKKINSDGFFSEYYLFSSDDLNPNHATEVHNEIGLSRRAILDLAPTNIEHHEMVHWANYYKRLKGNFDSMLNGYVINKTGNSQKYLSSQLVDFSLEEFEAHLLTLSILLHQQSLEPDLEEMEFIKSSILKDTDTLVYYALKAKKVLYKVLSKSQLFDDIGRVISPHELIWKVDRNEISTSNSAGTETLSLQQVPGGDSSTKHINYKFISNDLLLNLEFMIPLPQGLESIEDLLSHDFQAQYHRVVRTVNLRIRFLIRLTKYIENLKTDLMSNKKLVVSPKVHLHRLEEAYLYQVR